MQELNEEEMMATEGGKISKTKTKCEGPYVKNLRKQKKKNQKYNEYLYEPTTTYTNLKAGTQIWVNTSIQRKVILNDGRVATFYKAGTNIFMTGWIAHSMV